MLVFNCIDVKPTFLVSVKMVRVNIFQHCLSFKVVFMGIKTKPGSKKIN